MRIQVNLVVQKILQIINKCLHYLGEQQIQHQHHYLEKIQQPHRVYFLEIQLYHQADYSIITYLTIILVVYSINLLVNQLRSLRELVFNNQKAIIYSELLQLQYLTLLKAYLVAQQFQTQQNFYLDNH